MILSLHIVSPLVSYVSVKHIVAYIVWICSSSHACTTVKTSCVHVVIGRLTYTTSTFHQCSQPVSQRPLLDELDEQLLVSKSAVIHHDARMESNHSDCSAAPTTLRRHLSTCLSLLDLLWPTASVVVVVSLLNDILLSELDLPIAGFAAGGRHATQRCLRILGLGAPGMAGGRLC